MKFIHDFMQSLKKQKRQGGGQGSAAGGGSAGMISLNLLPKESVVEFKKSKCKIIIKS